MLRAPLFALLSVIVSKHFSDNWAHTCAVKEGCLRFLVYDDLEILKMLNITKSFIGWQYIMNDMALNNELTDIKIINFPNMASHNL